MSRAKRLPRGFRRGHDDSLACKHRDLSCCPECVAKYPEIVNVVGRHFWVPDEQERAELLAVVAPACVDCGTKIRRPIEDAAHVDGPIRCHDCGVARHLDSVTKERSHG